MKQKAKKNPFTQLFNFALYFTNFCRYKVAKHNEKVFVYGLKCSCEYNTKHNCCLFQMIKEYANCHTYNFFFPIWKEGIHSSNA